MQSFIYNSLPGRVVFGQGQVSTVADEVRALGLSRVMVLSTPGQAALAQRIAALLGPLSAGVYSEAVMHVPAEVASAAVRHMQEQQADGTVAVGGGSTIGLGKAVALETGLPQIAVPTTYAGSEMTPIWGITTDGVKTTGRDQRVMPKTVIYDPDLSSALPTDIVATSGMNAIAHCVEALYAKDANPVTSMMAQEGIRALGSSLPAIIAEPGNAGARSDALYGAWLAGSVLGQVGMALHHKICHVLGGSFNLPHAQVHTVMLPYATAFNSDHAAAAMTAIAAALGSDNAAQGLYDLAVKLDAPHALKDIGMREEQLDEAADIATRNPYYNPREVTRDNVRALLQAAYEGQRPL